MKDKGVDILIWLILGVIGVILIIVGEIATIIAGGFLLAWTLATIRFVGPDEHAYLIIFGSPQRYCDSGPHFVPFLPFCYLRRFPKTLYNLDFPSIVVVTKADSYGGKNYGTQIISVHAIAYLRFPVGDNLLEILRSRIPIEEEKLLDWAREAVASSVRGVFSQFTWKEATEKVWEVASEAENAFKSPDGALAKAGFMPDNLNLAIPEIILPAELAKVLPEVDRQRLEAEAAPFESQQRSEETIGAFMENMSRLTGLSRSDIEKELAEKSNEFIEKHREEWNLSTEVVEMRMAIDGKSFLYTHSPQGTTIESAIGLWHRMPRGGGSESAKQKSKVDEVIEEEQMGI